MCFSNRAPLLFQQKKTYNVSVLIFFYIHSLAWFVFFSPYCNHSKCSFFFFFFFVGKIRFLLLLSHCRTGNIFFNSFFFCVAAVLTAFDVTIFFVDFLAAFSFSPRKSQARMSLCDCVYIFIRGRCVFVCGNCG